jgi:lipid II:glycine glycyltransferase (peptidoglycan interpeptide bridge formation enzyme)
VTGFEAVAAGAAEREAWDEFVASRPEGDVLQLWAWGDLIAGEGVERPERLVIRADDGRIRGVAQALVRRTSFGRSILYVPHGPLWDRQAPDGPLILSAALAGLAELARATHGIVVKVDPRATSLASDDAAALRSRLLEAGLKPSGSALQAEHTRIITIEPDEDARTASWSGDARNRSRRAAREGTRTEVFRTPDQDGLAAFGELLGATSKRAGFRVRRPDFYAGLATALAPRGRFHLVVARWKDRPIAATFAVGVGDRSFYLYGASDHDAPRHAYGSYAAMAALLEALATDGVRTLDVWGVAGPDDEDAAAWAGFSEFKIRFGGEPLEHPGTFDLVVDPVWWTLRRVRERVAGTP